MRVGEKNGGLLVLISFKTLVSDSLDFFNIQVSSGPVMEEISHPPALVLWGKGTYALLPSDLWRSVFVKSGTSPVHGPGGLPLN